MTSLNTVALVGRITQDTKLQFTGRDNPYIFFSVAVNRNVKKGDSYEEETSYIDCQLYGRSAESLEKYLTKGKLVSLEGSLRQNRWEKDGKTVSRLVVIVRDLQLLGSKGAGEVSAEAPKQGAFADDDIPF